MLGNGEDKDKRFHPAPFLYVSGNMNPTAKGLLETIQKRGFDLMVFDRSTFAEFALALPTKPKKTPSPKGRVTI